MKTKMLLLLLLLSLLTLAPKPSEVKALQGNGVYQHSLQSDGLNLNIEILADDLAHFEIAFIEDATQAIWTSPMVAKTDYAGPTQLNVINETTLETAEMRLEIDPIALCVTVTDISRSAEYNLTTICP